MAQSLFIFIFRLAAISDLGLNTFMDFYAQPPTHASIASMTFIGAFLAVELLELMRILFSTIARCLAKLLRILKPTAKRKPVAKRKPLVRRKARVIDMPRSRPLPLLKDKRTKGAESDSSLPDD